MQMFDNNRGQTRFIKYMSLTNDHVVLKQQLQHRFYQDVDSDKSLLTSTNTLSVLLLEKMSLQGKCNLKSY